MTDTFSGTTASASGEPPAGTASEDDSRTRTIADSAATTAFREHIARVDTEAEDRAVARQHAKGKQTARERIDALLDADTFLEIGRYTGSGAGAGARPSGVVTGFGQIDGRQVAVYSQDFSVSGGALGTIEGDKIVRLLDDALRLRIPVIGIGAGGGVDGQVLVMHDMLGINQDFSPRFLRRYADLNVVITDAVQAYIGDIKTRDFPNEKEQY